jgi:hypothetical protein
MAATDLTRVERGALLVLMAEGRPLKESSELKAIHAIQLTRSHRENLQRLGLIQTKTRPLTHALTNKGWQWVWEEAAVEQPKGYIGLGAVNAVLQGVRRYAEQRGCALEEVFGHAPPGKPDRGGSPPPPDTGRQHMHEAAWSEADEALGQALQDLPILTKAIEALQKATTADVSAPVKRTSAAAKLVMQSIRQAGRKRELALAVEPGAETNFDPAIHRSEDQAQPGDRVRVRKPPVFRGPENNRVVVLLGEVEPV